MVSKASFSQIVVKTRSEAKGILKKLKRDASFEEIAKRRSLCPSGKNGGDLGFVGRGEMIPELERVAFALKIGETSGIVKTKLGYHIIRKTSEKEDESIGLKRKTEMLFAKIKQKSASFIEINKRKIFLTGLLSAGLSFLEINLRYPQNIVELLITVLFSSSILIFFALFWLSLIGRLYKSLLQKEEVPSYITYVTLFVTWSILVVVLIT